ncbi:protein FAR1-RELATED SEQUENCE 5-like [Chenopodium quinoa]|uniref:protein FAR1-RELATED SEQUENCE 5-like n=1 Tax=Chenopodium quinoa TaxID=63459 RepID=UPI000B79265D|nr:protein FAR1-RELATED SEQUENCE 5-like [Chenopodium quinoa]
MRKVPVKVGTQFCYETEFLKKLSAVVWDREIDPHVFVDGWNNVMEEFDLVDHEWFTYMFKIRHLWIPAYFRDLFMGGLLSSTSRSEGENSFFCNFINPHVTCVEFFVRYETALDAQRHEQDELNRLNKYEPLLVTHLHLEKHADVVYSRAIFYDFQEECQASCFSCGVESCSSLYVDGVEFSVIVDHEKRKNFYVNFDLATYECKCTCKMFESQGILCRHILFIMKGMSIREILGLYIMNRWRKDILKKALGINNVVLDDASKYDKKKQLVSDVWSKIFSCVSLSEQSEDDLSELIRTLSSSEEQMLTKNNLKNATSSKEVKYADTQVLVGSNEVDVGNLVFHMTVETVQTSSSSGILPFYYNTWKFKDVLEDKDILKKY